MTQPRENAPDLQIPDSDSINPGSQELVGQQVGNYKLTGWLGRGAAAEVYRAIEQPLERQVALKIMAKNSDNSDPNFASRFLMEARAIAGLHHPNIITIYQYGEWLQRPYLVTELMEGGSLKEVLTQNRQLDVAETVAMVAQVGAALEAAHSHNIIHRDVKPSNVLLDGQGRAVLADFGIAKVLNAKDGLTMTGMSIGTPEYMSPEQAMGQPVDRRSDIYSLGVLTYRMLAGRSPFENESALAVLIAHSRETPPPLRRFNPTIPPTVEAVVLRALAKNPDERYQTASQFVNALQAAAGAGPQVNPRPMPPLQAIPNDAPDLGAKTMLNQAAPPPVNFAPSEQEMNPAVYDEPTSFNPVVPGRQPRQSYVQPPVSYYDQNYAPIPPPGPYVQPQYDYNNYQEQYVAPPQPEYYAPAPEYAAPAPPRPRKRRRGLSLLAFIVGVLLAAGIVVGVWYYFLQGKDSGNIAVNTPSPSATQAGPNPNLLQNSRLIFASTRNGKWGIYTANYQGQNLQKIIDNDSDDISPALAPDGKSLLYVAAPGSVNWQIHKTNPDGSNDVALTSGNYKFLYPAWSPDSKSIAYIRVAPVPNAENGTLFIMDADGKNPRQIGSDQVGYVSWSPNNLLIYSYINGGNHALRLFDPGNSQTKNLDNLGTGEFDLPAWSPDGKNIAFVKGTGDTRAVFTANADGTGAVQISPNGTTATYPVWSPDGSRLAYLQKVGLDGTLPKWEIVESGSKGDNPQKLFNDGQQKFYLSWGK